VTQSAKRGVAAFLTVVAAAATGLVTNVVTDKPLWAWWVAFAILVAVGASLQYYLSRDGSPEDSARPTTALGAGSVSIGGSSRATIKTRVVGRAQLNSPVQPHGVTATGPGAVAVGGDAEGPIETEIAQSPEETR
jgi:hypothetical protein